MVIIEIDVSIKLKRLLIAVPYVRYYLYERLQMQTESELIIQANTLPYGRIYRLTNKIDGKMYHGQTTEKYINKRWNVYKRLQCKRQPKLYNALKKYGWDNFLAEVIDTTPQDQLQLDELEIYYIAKFDSMNNGYNGTEGGHGGGKLSKEAKKKISESKMGEKNPNFGKPLSEEHKRKISESNSGNKNVMFGKCGKLSPIFGFRHSDESKMKMSKSKKGTKNPNFGKALSKEMKQKLSEVNKGNKYSLGHHHSDETKKILSDAFSGKNNPMFGKHLSEETKKKISEAQTGNKNHNFGQRGKHHSEETKRKISEARKLYYQRKRELLTPFSPS